jgi:hypothetical protein
MTQRRELENAGLGACLGHLGHGLLNNKSEIYTVYITMGLERAECYKGAAPIFFGGQNDPNDPKPPAPSAQPLGFGSFGS